MNPPPIVVKAEWPPSGLVELQLRPDERLEELIARLVEAVDAEGPGGTVTMTATYTTGGQMAPPVVVVQQPGESIADLADRLKAEIQDQVDEGWTIDPA